MKLLERLAGLIFVKVSSVMTSEEKLLELMPRLRKLKGQIIGLLSSHEPTCEQIDNFFVLTSRLGDVLNGVIQDGPPAELAEDLKQLQFLFLEVKRSGAIRAASGWNGPLVPRGLNRIVIVINKLEKSFARYFANQKRVGG